MAFTFYDSSIVASKHVLDSLTHLIDIAEKHPNASNLPSARLAEDMRPFSSQIHLVTIIIFRICHFHTCTCTCDFFNSLPIQFYKLNFMLHTTSTLAFRVGVGIGESTGTNRASVSMLPNTLNELFLSSFSYYFLLSFRRQKRLTKESR